MGLIWINLVGTYGVASAQFFWGRYAGLILRLLYQLSPVELADPINWKWLIVYVLLSRVPSLAQLRAVDLHEKVRKIIEKGPPAWLLDAFDNLKKDKHPRTKAACAKARLAMGW